MASNGGGPFWLQSARLVAAVVELGSLLWPQRSMNQPPLETRPPRPKNHVAGIAFASGFFAVLLRWEGLIARVHPGH